MSTSGRSGGGSKPPDQKKVQHKFIYAVFKSLHVVMMIVSARSLIDSAPGRLLANLDTCSLHLLKLILIPWHQVYAEIAVIITHWPIFFSFLVPCHVVLDTVVLNCVEV